jgi:hypothetical protein
MPLGMEVARKDALCDEHMAAHCFSCATFTPPYPKGGGKTYRLRVPPNVLSVCL